MYIGFHWTIIAYSVTLVTIMPSITEKELFEAGAHIGYSKSRRHPKMNRFIFGTRNNMEIFDLTLTAEKLNEAEEFLRLLGKEGGAVLWVGTKPAAQQHILEIGKALRAPCVAERWLGGTLTNFKVFESRLLYWENLENEAKAGGFEKYLKKERLLKEREMRKLERMFGGIKSLKSLPAALVIVDPLEEKTAMSEARRKQIPIVALLNTDCNPEGIAYPVPMNDNSSGAVALVLNKLKEAYEAGVKERS